MSDVRWTCSKCEKVFDPETVVPPPRWNGHPPKVCKCPECGEILIRDNCTVIVINPG